MKKIIIWYNPSKNLYYYKIVRGLYYESYDYVVGSINSYGHIIVLIIPLSEIINNNKNSPLLLHKSIRRKFYSSIYSYAKKRM